MMFLICTMMTSIMRSFILGRSREKTGVEAPVFFLSLFLFVVYSKEKARGRREHFGTKYSEIDFSKSIPWSWFEIKSEPRLQRAIALYCGGVENVWIFKS